MRRFLFACATVVTGLAAVFTSATAVKAQSVNGQGVPLKIDYENPPSSWQAAINRADLVAVLRLRALTNESASGEPSTRFDADVVEVIGGRSAGSVGKEIVVIRFGGLGKSKSGIPQIVEETGFPAWKVGGVFLAFLEWSASKQGYYVQFGPDSAFEEEPVTKKVHTSGRGSLARSRNGRPFGELVAEVKAAKRSKESPGNCGAPDRVDGKSTR